MANNKNNTRKQGDGMLRLRKDGRWEGRIVIGYDEKGDPKTKNVTARTQEECEKKLRALKEELGQAAQKIHSEMTFGEWIDYWYQSFCKPGLRDSTKTEYENAIYRHIIPSIGHIPLYKLTQNDLQQFYANLKKNGRLQYTDTCGKGVSDRTVRSCHAQCRASLEKAVSEGLISKNPSTGCKLPPKKGKEMKILSKNELGRFFVRAKEEGYYELFLLELSTGMRRGEIVGLKWSDFDEADGLLRITRQVNRVGGKTVVQSPKTKSSVRTMVLPKYMTEILSEMKRDAVCDWMFPSPVNIGEPRNPSALYKRFQLLLERSGCKQVRFHDLRHTFATMALENGMNIKILSDMIGHSSAETTLNIYSHVTDTMRTQASVKIDRKIGGTNAEMPNTQINIAEQFEPYVPKIRKSGTGCLYQVNENLWEGSFYPKMPNGKRKKFNVYAKTKEECEQMLTEMIAEKKTEIAAEKAQMERA